MMTSNDVKYENQQRRSAEKDTWKILALYNLFSQNSPIWTFFSYHNKYIICYTRIFESILLFTQPPQLCKTNRAPSFDQSLCNIVNVVQEPNQFNKHKYFYLYTAFRLFREAIGQQEIQKCKKNKYFILKAPLCRHKKPAYIFWNSYMKKPPQFVKWRWKLKCCDYAPLWLPVLWTPVLRLRMHTCDLMLLNCYNGYSR